MAQHCINLMYMHLKTLRKLSYPVFLKLCSAAWQLKTSILLVQ